jgi:hypothetical protein
MTNVELVSFAISVCLGVISFVLAVFAIWLSVVFERRSSAALDAIRDFAVEIRSLVDASVSQHKEFSTKMLDSIISRDQYGNINEVEEHNLVSADEVIRSQFRDMELRIADTIEDKIRSLSTKEPADQVVLQDAIESIRRDVKSLTNSVAASVSSYVGLPSPLQVALRNRRDYPAHYLLLAAISKEDITTIDELEAVQQKYNLPSRYEGGLENLLQDSILEGSESNFRIAEDYRAPLALWIDKNWPHIRKLIDHYGQRGATDDDLDRTPNDMEEERAISKLFDF